MYAWVYVIYLPAKCNTTSVEIIFLGLTNDSKLIYCLIKKIKKQILF